jgi:phosphate transport system substrate-binding protein
VTLKIGKAFSKLPFVFVVCTQLVLAESQSPKSEAAQMKRVETRVDGAGSTTIYPLLSAWLGEYNRAHPRTPIYYQAIGSKAGIYALTHGTAFFAATDVPMTDDQLANASGRILHIPVALNAIVPAYNLAHIPDLRFSPDTLAGIFLGRITKWNDPAIAGDNPGVDLPELEIRVFHRFPKGDPETFVMADYLAKVSPDVKATLTNSSGNWPLSRNSYRGALGAAGFVHDTPGAIGYVWQNLVLGVEQYGVVKNASGEFVAASPESLRAAGLSAALSIDAQARDFRVSITNAPGKKSYPIASFAWILLYEDSKEGKKNEVMNDFVKWVLTDGQRVAMKLGYPSLPSNLVEIELQRLKATPK